MVFYALTQVNRVRRCVRHFLSFNAECPLSTVERGPSKVRSGAGVRIADWPLRGRGIPVTAFER